MFENKRKTIGPAPDTLSKVHFGIMGAMGIGFLGFFGLRDSWAGLIFAHLTGLAILAFLGALTGWLACRKGYGYGRAFGIGFFLPLVLGVIAAFLWVPGDTDLPLGCGGWIAMAAGIAVSVVAALMKSVRKDPQA